MVHFGVSTERSRQQQLMLTHVTEQALSHLSRLEAELNADVFLADGMVAYIISQNGINQPSTVIAAQTLYTFGRHVHSIAVAPGNRISLVYPLADNAAAMGIYYPDAPLSWPPIRRAIETRSTVLAGPVTLRQGGSGLIIRTPIFLPDGRYWGLVSLVVDADDLFRSVGLDGSASSENVRYAIRGTDGTGKDGSVFYGDPRIFSQDAMVMDVRVPGGLWQLAAIPVKEWQKPNITLVEMETTGLLLALLVSAGVWALLHNNRRVAESEFRLRTFLNITQDGVITIDDQGIVRTLNPAAEALFGYDSAEVLDQPVVLLIPSFVPIQGCFSGKHDTQGRRKDGSEFPIEVSTTCTLINGRHMHMSMLRDITERKAYERQLMELATTDSLTGVQNRRAFLEGAREIFMVRKRYKRPLSLLMIDADHFKEINDTYGHGIGDTVLVLMAQVAKNCLRSTDRFARFGGEEFVVLLPETDQDYAIEAAERLLSAIRSQLIPDGRGGTFCFTVSIGIASLTPDMRTLDDLLLSADNALYEAKGRGRDRWCLPPES